MGVVHIAAEYGWLARTGGLAEAVQGLAKNQAAQGIPVAVIIPLHRSVRSSAPATLKDNLSFFGLAVEADGSEVTTIEGLQTKPDELHPLQESFMMRGGAQCGFCTPGILMTLTAYLERHPAPSEPEIREALSGNLCRCTGYQNIVLAALDAAGALRGEATT